MMGMNNVYYRFTHLSSNAQYQTLRAGLRMNVIGAPGVDKAEERQIQKSPGLGRNILLLTS
jgi:hypothetical protein